MKALGYLITKWRVLSKSKHRTIRSRIIRGLSQNAIFKDLTGSTRSS